MAKMKYKPKRYKSPIVEKYGKNPGGPMTPGAKKKKKKKKTAMTSKRGR